MFDLFFFFGVGFEQEFGMYNQQEELPFSVCFFFFKLLHDPAPAASSGLAANAAAIEVGKTATWLGPSSCERLFFDGC